MFSIHTHTETVQGMISRANEKVLVTVQARELNYRKGKSAAWLYTVKLKSESEPIEVTITTGPESYGYQALGPSEHKPSFHFEKGMLFAESAKAMHSSTGQRQNLI